MGKWLGPPHGKICRCQAKARSGQPCGQYAMQNGRCRFHGGKSTGANKPHRPLKHGMYTKESIAERKTVKELIQISKETIESV